MTRLNKTFFILIFLLSPVSFASGVESCGPDLSLLDDRLITVLNDMVKLQLEGQSLESTSAFGIKLFSLIDEKGRALEKIIPDEKIRVAAKKYIADQLAKASIDREKTRREEVVVESEQRRIEEKLLSNYDLVGKKDLHFGNFGRFMVTPEGVVVGEKDHTHLLVEDVLQNISKKVSFSPEHMVNALALYNYDTNEVFLGGNDHIQSFKITDVTQSASASFSLGEKSEVLKLDELTLNKMKDAIELAFPGAEPNFNKHGLTIPGLFRGFFKTVNQGRVLASFFEMKMADESFGRSIIVFNRDTQEFKVMKLLLGNADDPGKWAISPDGRYILGRMPLNQEWGLRLYDLNESRIVRDLPFITRVVSFSHHGHWAVARTDIVAEDKKYVLFDPFGKRGQKEFKFPSEINAEDSSSYPRYFSFNADDSRFIIANNRGQSWVWDIETETLLESNRQQGVDPIFSRDNVTLFTKKTTSDAKVPSQVLIWKRKP